MPRNPSKKSTKDKTQTSRKRIQNTKSTSRNTTTNRAVPLMPNDSLECIAGRNTRAKTRAKKGALVEDEEQVQPVHMYGDEECPPSSRSRKPQKKPKSKSPSPSPRHRDIQSSAETSRGKSPSSSPRNKKAPVKTPPPSFEDMDEIGIPNSPAPWGRNGSEWEDYPWPEMRESGDARARAPVEERMPWGMSHNLQRDGSNTTMSDVSRNSDYSGDEVPPGAMMLGENISDDSPNWNRQWWGDQSKWGGSDEWERPGRELRRNSSDFSLRDEVPVEGQPRLVAAEKSKLKLATSPPRLQLQPPAQLPLYMYWQISKLIVFLALANLWMLTPQLTDIRPKLAVVVRSLPLAWLAAAGTATIRIEGDFRKKMVIAFACGALGDVGLQLQGEFYAAGLLLHATTLLFIMHGIGLVPLGNILIPVILSLPAAIVGSFIIMTLSNPVLILCVCYVLVAAFGLLWRGVAQLLFSWEDTRRVSMISPALILGACASLVLSEILFMFSVFRSLGLDLMSLVALTYYGGLAVFDVVPYLRKQRM